MRGNTLKEKIENRFSDTHFSKIILYRNPNEFTSLYIERINPDHVGILWGKRHKKFKKGSHYVKCGMVYFSCLFILWGTGVLAWLDVVTGFFYAGLINIGLFGLLTGLTTCLMFYGAILWLDHAKRVCPVCNRPYESG